MRRIPAALLCALLALSLAAVPSAAALRGAASAPAPKARAKDPGKAPRGVLQAPALKSHLKALQTIAKRHRGSRAPGTAGDRATAAYVSRTLKRAGWRVRAQPFSFPYFWERSPAALKLVGGTGFQPGKDFTTLTYSGSGSVEGPLRTAGNGCAVADFDRVGEDEVALVTRGGCQFRQKAEGAQVAGALALIVVDPTSGAAVPTGSLLQLGTRIPALVVGAAAGQALRAAAPARVRVSVNATSEQRTTANLIAETPKSSGGRVAMAGAHLDSVPGSPGINTDGSGVAALLEIARSLRGRAPGGPVRLGFWGAEEPGLFGSTFYVSQLGDAERKRIAAYLNLDTIGSRHPKRAVYTGGDGAIETLLRGLVGPRAVAEDQARARSDHTPFQAAGIPVGGLFTGAGKPWDPCYHRACDTVANVNLKVLAQLTRVTATALARLSRQAK